MEDHMDDEEKKRLRRDAAIRAKENDYIRKQREEEEAKKQLLEVLKKEYEMQEQRRMEERLRLLQKQAEVRAQKKAEADKLIKKRDQAIEKRKVDWKERANAKIQNILDERDAEESRIADATAAARARKKEAEDAQAQEKILQEGRQWHLDNKRTQEQLKKESVRRNKALERVDKLKAEAHEELQLFIENPFPVPLKQVLAGRMTCPSVTQLLATHKDQKEMLKELESQDVTMRALLRNQSLFQYVRDVQMEAEAHSVQPPEPVGMKSKAKTAKSGATTSFAASKGKKAAFRGTR